MNTFKYHVFAPMGRFQLESIYLYFPPSSLLIHRLITLPITKPNYKKELRYIEEMAVKNYPQVNKETKI